MKWDSLVLTPACLVWSLGRLFFFLSFFFLINIRTFYNEKWCTILSLWFLFEFSSYFGSWRSTFSRSVGLVWSSCWSVVCKIRKWRKEAEERNVSEAFVAFFVVTTQLSTVLVKDQLDVQLFTCFGPSPPHFVLFHIGWLWWRVCSYGSVYIAVLVPREHKVGYFYKNCLECFL